MLELTQKEIDNLLEINKSILFKTKVRLKTCIFKIMKTVNRDHYLSEREAESLTQANLEEQSTIDEKTEENYTKINPLKNDFIYHNEIKRLLQGKETGYYINPLEVYKYYESRGHRLTLVKLFILISHQNKKFTKGDINPLAVNEALLSNYATQQDIDITTFINIVSNYLATIEIEYQKQATNLIDIKRVNSVNKELVITLKKYLIENKIALSDVSSNDQPEISNSVPNDNFKSTNCDPIKSTENSQTDKTLKKQI